MKKIVAVNASPRTAWNTATLVREAAKGAEEQGAEVEIFDLYKLEPFTGCVSCLAASCPKAWVSASARTGWPLCWKPFGMQTD